MVKKTWEFSFQLMILIGIYQVGNQITRFLQLQIPGNVIGMLLLFILLWMGVIKIEQIDIAAGWMLKHLGFFFIPISVGLMTLGSLISSTGMILLFILIVSALIGLISAGKITQTVINQSEKEKVNYHDHSL